MNTISIVVPCFNEEDSLRFFHQEICKIKPLIPDVDWDIIFVNDGSTDNTLKEIKRLSSIDDCIRYISFSRNFGKEAAIYAGLNNSHGDFVAIMDADLQDPPSLLPQMYRIVSQEGYDSVATRRVSRKGEPPIRSFFARMFYRLMNRISQTDIVDGARDYRLINRNFVNALLSLKEYNRFSKGLFGWVGFKTKWIEFENVDRVAGETKWSFWSLFKYSIEGIVAFSRFPLVLSFFAGFLFCFVSVIMSIVFAITGYDFVSFGGIIDIAMFFSGIQLIFMGIQGLYISRTHTESKKRPIYIVRESSEEDKK